MPAWTRLARERVAELRVQLAELLERGGREAPEDLEIAEAAATLIRQLRLDPLYASLIRAGRRPVLRPAMQFHAIGIGHAVVPAVAEGLRDAHPSVREFACCCAGSLRDEALAEPLIGCLNDSHAVVREMAVRALAQLRATEAVAPLAERLMDAEPAVQEAAQEALGSLDPTAASQALLDFPRRDPAIMIAMLRVMRASPHPDQLPFLVDCLRGDDAGIRRLAVESLAEHPGMDVVDLLEPALDDPDDEVRHCAIKVFGRRRTARATELLLGLLARAPTSARLLVETLVDMDGLAVVPRLLAIYTEHPGEAYLPILVELAHRREPAAEPLVVALLGDPDPETRRTAIRALAMFGSAVATRHIIASATDPAWQVRATVAEVLGDLAHPDARVELERLCLDEHTFVATSARHRLELDEGF
jgi:HEAT repeat protein